MEFKTGQTVKTNVGSERIGEVIGVYPDEIAVISDDAQILRYRPTDLTVISEPAPEAVLIQHAKVGDLIVKAGHERKVTQIINMPPVPGAKPCDRRHVPGWPEDDTRSDMWVRILITDHGYRYFGHLPGETYQGVSIPARS